MVHPLPWNELLRQARGRAGLSQAGLARLAGVSEPTISNYERGSTRPTRETVLRLTGAMQLDREATNRILSGADLDRLPSGKLSQLWEQRLPLDRLQREVAAYPWPCLVNNERMEIVAWNEPANRVAELDFGRDLPLPHQRHMLRIAVRPEFLAGMQNWDEMVSVVLGMLKDEHPELGQLMADEPYYKTLINELLHGSPQVAQRLLGLWHASPPRHEDSRLTFQPIWRVRDGTELRFNCVLTPWSDFDAEWAFDWHPADAVTWRWLREAPPVTGQDQGAPPGAGPAAAANGPAGPYAPAASAAPWFQLLRWAREGAGLSRSELAEQSGVSMDTIVKYELRRGRHPQRDHLVRLARAMPLAAGATNELLTAAGHQPEPSEWALTVAGTPPRALKGGYVREEAVRQAGAKLRDLVGAHPWPCLIVNERCEIIVGNAPAAQVIGHAIPHGLRELRLHNLARFALSREFRERVVNWEEVVTVLLPSTLKHLVAGSNGAGGAGPFASVVESLRDEDPAVLRQLLDVWRAAPPPSSVRAYVPLVWCHADGTPLSFNCVLAPWNPMLGVWAIDWHPADADTWEWLGAAT